MIDTLHRVETPEGVELSLRPAGPVPRALAWAIDVAVQGFGLLALQLLASGFGESGIGLWLIGLFLCQWFYPVAFEVGRGGRTPGKSALGLQVVHEDGTPVRISASVLRNFLRLVDWLPSAYLLGVCAMCVDGSFRRLGDLAAGTLVVYAGRGGTPRAAAQAPAPAQPLAPLAPPVPLSLEEQSALIAFAERSPRLTPARARELAALATPLLDGGDPAQRLERIAAWLVGRPA